MASKEKNPGSSPFGRSQERGAGSWDDLMSDIQATEDAKTSFFREASERVGRWIGRIRGKLGGTALDATTKVGGDAFSSRADDSYTTSGPETGSVEDDQAGAPESQSGDSGGDNENDKPAGDASTVETDDSSESETVDDSVEAAKKDLEKERSVVAKDLTEAMQQLIEHKPGDPAYNGLLARVKGLRNRFNYISEQIKEESGTDGKRDDIEDKSKGSAESQETSESEDDKKDKKSPEAPTPEDAARAKIAELEKILNDDNATDDEKYRAAYMRKQLLNGLMSKSSEGTKSAGDASKVETADDGSGPEPADDSAEATKKDLKKERSAVAKELAEAMQQLSKHKSGDPAYDGLSARVRGLRNRFNYISKQIRGEVDDDEGVMAIKKRAKN